MSFTELIPNWLRQELEELNKARLGVVVVFLMGSVFGFGVGRMWYSDRIAFLQDQLNQRPATAAAGSSLSPTSPLTTMEDWISRPMIPVVGRSFMNETVDIDGKRFVNCQFANVTLRYRGSGHVELIDVKINGAMTFFAEAPAINTALRLYDAMKSIPGTKFSVTLQQP